MRWVAALLFLVVAARADVVPAAGSIGGESHGWIAMPLTGGEDRAVILHLPPRRDATRTDGTGDLADGSVRPALHLKQMPERLGAWGEDLWIAFGLEGGQTKRRVLRMSVQRAAMGGAWASPEAEGRLPSLPSLPGDKDLAGFVGTALGPAALMRGGTAELPEYSLLVGSDSGWRELALPDGFIHGWDSRSAELSRVDLAASPRGPSLVVTEAGRCTVWRGEFHKSAKTAAVAVEWKRSELSMSVENGGSAPPPRMQPYFVAGQLTYVVGVEQGVAEIWNPGESGCRRLARISGVQSPGGVVPLDGIGRLALLCEEPAPPAAGAPARRATRVIEVSVFSGAVLFDGPANVRGPVSAMELRALAIVLVAVMAVVLIVVLRPEGVAGGVSLPLGLALAEPGRRMAAAVIDLIVAIIVTSWVRRVSPLELLSPGSLLSDPAGLQTMGLVLGAGFVHCTIGEWLFGRTIGKSLTGCTTMAVMHARPGADGVLEPVLVRPSFWRAAVRNLVRWTLPPLAIAGLNGPDHRHRGDVAAGTVVVMRVQDEAEGAD